MDNGLSKVILNVKILDGVWYDGENMYGSDGDNRNMTMEIV